jgi:hypothetical protein
MADSSTWDVPMSFSTEFVRKAHPDQTKILDSSKILLPNELLLLDYNKSYAINKIVGELLVRLGVRF